MQFRFARHTNDLERIKIFYTTILGFEILGDFENHDSYSGVFLGFSNTDWHLEFTTSDEKANHYFDEDDILVLYPENQKEYDYLLEKVARNNIALITPKNPYWNENGKMILDPDGYRIILSPLKITD